MNRLAWVTWCALTILVSSAAAQAPVWIGIGAGALNPDDPFAATLGLRGSVGFILGAKNAVAFEYSRQSSNRSEGNDLGKFGRRFVGFVWEHGFSDVFADRQSLRRRYLVRVGGGALLRGTFPEAVGDQRLKRTSFIDVGMGIRYPFTRHVTAVGIIEDALAFLPAERVRSYCGQSGFVSSCYPRGGSAYFQIDLAKKTQHNFGVLAMVQLRP